jgi:hypothetical protein
MSALFAKKALTGFAALALAAAGTALPGSDANAAPLIFDCYSRSTSDLLMKSALDLSNDSLACVQAGAAQVSYQPAPTQPVYVAPAPAPSGGESFFGSMLGGAIGGVLGNAINGGNRTTVEHHYHDKNRGRGKQQEPADKPAPDTTVTQPIVIAGHLGAGTAIWQAAEKQRQQKMIESLTRYTQAQQQLGTIKKNVCLGNPFAPGCR